MCPRSGDRSGGTCKRTVVPVLFQGNIRMYVPGNIRQNHPFGKPLLSTPECVFTPEMVNYDLPCGFMIYLSTRFADLVDHKSPLFERGCW